MIINHENPPVGSHSQNGMVGQDSAGYDEPPRTGQSTNTEMTDNAQALKVMQNVRTGRRTSFGLGVQD